MILFAEEDSDEIKIGTACKNAGCSKVSDLVSLLHLPAKLLRAQFCLALFVPPPPVQIDWK